jgi:hypothetical protein
VTSSKQGISGKQAGKLLAGQIHNEAANQSRIVKAQVSSVTDRATTGQIKCTIPSTGQTVYVEAAASVPELVVNDFVYIQKMDAGWRDMWIFYQWAHNSDASSYVPTVRESAQTLDKLIASDGDPDPAWSTDQFGNLIAQSTCVIAVEGHALGVTLDADKDTGIEAQTDDEIDIIIATAESSSAT